MRNAKRPNDDFWHCSLSEAGGRST